jgi:hypothetical protein
MRQPIKALPPQKRTPSSGCFRGFCRLLPQLVGSFDPSGRGVGGWGAARIGPIQREVRITSRFGFGYLPIRHNNHVIVITARVAIAADWAIALARLEAVRQTRTMQR